jgi:hypothetical protein
MNTIQSEQYRNKKAWSRMNRKPHQHGRDDGRIGVLVGSYIWLEKMDQSPFSLESLEKSSGALLCDSERK